MCVSLCVCVFVCVYVPSKEFDTVCILSSVGQCGEGGGRGIMSRSATGLFFG